MHPRIKTNTNTAKQSQAGLENQKSLPIPSKRSAKIIMRSPMGRFSSTFRDFGRKDLRWSYGAVAILIVIGVLSNIFFRHGWAIWPFCFAAGAMAMVHEAAERTGQGVPPFYVYGGVVAVLVIWAVVAAIASFLHPIVLFIGFAVISYQLLKGFIPRS